MCIPLHIIVVKSTQLKRIQMESYVEFTFLDHMQPYVELTLLDHVQDVSRTYSSDCCRKLLIGVLNWEHISPIPLRMDPELVSITFVGVSHHVILCLIRFITLLCPSTYLPLCISVCRYFQCHSSTIYSRFLIYGGICI